MSPEVGVTRLTPHMVSIIGHEVTSIRHNIIIMVTCSYRIECKKSIITRIMDIRTHGTGLETDYVLINLVIVQIHPRYCFCKAREM